MDYGHETLLKSPRCHTPCCCCSTRCCVLDLRPGTCQSCQVGRAQNPQIMVNPPFLAFPCPVKCRQDLFHWGRLHPVSPRRLVTASFSSASNLQRAARPHAFTQLLVNLNGCTNDLAGEIVCAHRTTLRQLDVFRRSRRLLFPGRRLPAIALAQARRAGLPAREKPSSSVASVPLW